ncbi:MAG: HlyD family type I secretion periplasmic adaptor subunit [Hyphomicrobiaceae bacterium]
MKTSNNRVENDNPQGAKKKDIQPDHGFGVMPRLAFGLTVVGILVIGCGGWAVTAELSGAVIAPGTVVVERHTKKIQHLDGGIVAKINVRNGDEVEAGDVLLTLDDTQLKASLSVINSQLLEIDGRNARLIAERDGAGTISFPAKFSPSVPEMKIIMEGETRLFLANQRTRLSQIEQLNIRIDQLRSEITGLKSQHTSKGEELALMTKEMKDVKYLYKKQLTAKTRYFAMQREMTRLTGEQASLMSQIARTEGKISETRVQILSIEQSTRAEAQKKLRENEARYTELRERKVAAKDQLSRVDIRAPLSGLVHELTAHTIGGVITAAEPVMYIVPEGDELTIEARLSPTDIDQVVPGQEVRLRFSAFSQQTSPELKGRVLKVSADVSQDPSSGQRYYMSRVAIDDDITAKLGDQKILPGMPVEVFVTTSKRTALSFLAKPFVDQVARTFREE